MRICIDAREVRNVETGVGRYAFSLVREIARLDPHNDYLLLRRAAYPRPIVVQPNFTDIAVPFGISTGRNLLGGARIVNPLRADIYHCLFHLLPLGVRAGRIVLTLHDLIWIDNPDIAYESRWRGWMARRFAGPWIGESVRRAHHVITISESTRQAAITRYPGPPSKFTVIHHGSDGSCAGNGDSRDLPEVCRGRRFIFSLGNTKPYKNIRRLIEAFGLVSKQCPDLFLMISGRGDGYATLAELTRNLGITRNVIFTEQLSDGQVRACFEEAMFFAFPSITEGFGLPVIEAMASGCPVLTSDASSLAEIAGSAAVLVDPMDVKAIAGGMTRLIRDDALRKRLVVSGRLQAARYTWRDCARKTLGVYNEIFS